MCIQSGAESEKGTSSQRGEKDQQSVRQQSPRPRAVNIRVFFAWPDPSKIALYLDADEGRHCRLSEKLYFFLFLNQCR